MTAVLILVLFIFSFILIKSADEVIIAVRRLSKNSSSFAFIVSAVFLAVATSLPELFVGLTSALGDVSTLSLGNVIGANIANLSLVAGIAAFVVGRVNIHQQFVKKEFLYAFLAGVLPLILALDGNLGRIDGLILITAYGAYASSFFKERFALIAEEFRQEHFLHRFFRKIAHIDGNKTREAGRLCLGIIFLLISANVIVEIAKIIAQSINMPVFLIGLILVSLGTTLPELVFSVRSLEDKEPMMFIGNLLGSIIVNSTLIIGVVAMISPIGNLILSDDLASFTTFVAIFALFWFFVRSKFRLERWEAGILLFFYLTFVVVEIL